MAHKSHKKLGFAQKPRDAAHLYQEAAMHDIGIQRRALQIIIYSTLS